MYFYKVCNLNWHIKIWIFASFFLFNNNMLIKFLWIHIKYTCKRLQKIKCENFKSKWDGIIKTDVDFEE